MHTSELMKRIGGPMNALFARRLELEAQGKRLVDLTRGHPSAIGIRFPDLLLARAFAAGVKRSRHDRPDPFGQRPARDAIAHLYRNEGLEVSPEAVLLTPGTSLSYLYAFQILADPGDEILVPQPCYPLFDVIAAAARVRLAPYRLRKGERWSLTEEALESAVSSKTRAVVLISPHNPTGMVATEEEVKILCAFARRHHLTIISDEVFSPFVFSPHRMFRPAACDAPLVLTLDGFSKRLALPGMKIGWTLMHGDREEVERFKRAAEMISDTFLPVNEAAQAAAPMLLKESGAFQARYRKKAALATAQTLRALGRLPGCTFTAPEGGFYMTLGLPSGWDEEATALRLLEHGFVAHPGYYYDLPGTNLALSTIQTDRHLDHFRTILKLP